MKLLKILLLSLLISCNFHKEEQLSIKLYSTLFYDSLKSANYFIVCQEISNNSDHNIYTFQPDIFINDAKMININNDYNLHKYTSKSFFKLDGYMKKIIRRGLPIDEWAIQSYNEKILDSFIKYRFNKMNIKLDSFEMDLQRGFWLFLNHNSKINLYYDLDLSKINQDNGNFIKIKTVHPDLQRNFSIVNTKKFPLPDNFLGYQLFKGRLNLDSLIIPLIY